MSGTLFLVATPIGNLKDMTERAIETLRGVKMIAAEDTRNSIKLLNHFEIKTPMTAYHEFNKYDKADTLVQMLLNGDDIALITDAGTPGISDPGEVLVSKCYENSIPVTSLPGCCALINALILSGLPTRRFSFEAFLPAEKKERKSILNEMKTDTRTLILYEAPHHLLKTLKELSEILGNRRIALCRELTKKFETVDRTTIDEAVRFYEDNEPKGEFVLVIEGKDPLELLHEEQSSWEELSVPEHVDLYIGQGLDKKSAMKKVAEDRGLSKRDVYRELISED